ncbi:MAG: hypothetical protein OEY14_14620, partial [Myxococcales bacterium]|nr:hypothetical protein [Myxococcales bacterium]
MLLGCSDWLALEAPGRELPEGSMGAAGAADTATLGGRLGAELLLRFDDLPTEGRLGQAILRLHPAAASTLDAEIALDVRLARPFRGDRPAPARIRGE